MDRGPNWILPKEQVNDTDLAERNRGNRSPCEPFAETQSALNRFAQGEIDFGSSYFDCITIAQESSLDGLAVDTRYRVRMAGQKKTFRRTKIELEMLIPDTVFL